MQHKTVAIPESWKPFFEIAKVYRNF